MRSGIPLPGCLEIPAGSFAGVRFDAFALQVHFSEFELGVEVTLVVRSLEVGGISIAIAFEPAPVVAATVR